MLRKPRIILQPKPECLTELMVYQSEWPKIRLGNENDGGYVIAELPGEMPYDLIISCGIATEDSFTRDAIKKYKCPSIAFDGTINEYPREFIVPDYPITFYRKNIGATNTDNTTNLTEYLRKYQNILLKMDIESHEYKWLLALTDSDLQNIKQITLEIHQFTYDIVHRRSNHSIAKIKYQDKMEVLKKLSRNFVLIHAHPNNNGTRVIINGHEMSELIELTYVRRSEFKSTDGLIPNSDEFPIPGLDFINVPYKPDITINFPPFVNP